MIEGGVLFATGHKREAGQIAEHSPRPILAVESEQGTGLWELVRGERACDRSQALAQFHAILPVATLAKTAEPLETVGLADDGARPHHLPALAPGVARGTHLIQPAKGRGQVFALW
jgi:hypothetical protein